MQQRPETPVTPSPMPQLSPELPPHYPPKKSKLWLWITLAIVGVLAIVGIIITPLLQLIQQLHVSERPSLIRIMTMRRIKTISKAQLRRPQNA